MIKLIAVYAFFIRIVAKIAAKIAPVKL